MKDISAGYIVFLVLLVTSCGWQLRGNAHVDHEQLPPSIDLQLDPLAHTLKIELANELENAGIEVSPGAEWVLRIYNEGYRKDVLTTGADSRVSEYSISYQFSWQLMDDEKTVAANDISRTRRYVFDPGRLNAMSSEEDRIREELRDALIQQLLREISRASLAR